MSTGKEKADCRIAPTDHQKRMDVCDAIKVYLGQEKGRGAAGGSGI
jgi:hypothetical protein